MRYSKILLIALALGLQSPAFAAGIPVKLYKNPNCGCCNTYADLLKANGFEVTAVNTSDMASIKKKYAIPESLEGCHTFVIDNYVFEGLVPVQFVKEVVSEHRPIKGLSLPGMPMGAPGMTGMKSAPQPVYYLSSGSDLKVFRTY